MTTTENIKKPTVGDLIELTVQTRRAQRTFFETRDSSWLSKSKDLEKQLDAMLEQITGKPIMPKKESAQQSIW